MRCRKETAEKGLCVQAGQGQRPPRLRVSIAPNPSHLESIGPVVLGMVRAEQARLRDYPARSRVAGLLIHGDAAFPGLGIVAETLQLANVPGALCPPSDSLWPLSPPCQISQREFCGVSLLLTSCSLCLQATRPAARCTSSSTTRCRSAGWLLSLSLLTHRIARRLRFACGTSGSGGFIPLAS